MDDATLKIGLPARLLPTVLVAAGGLVLLLVGLAWDAVLHARDPGLAAEGACSPSRTPATCAGVGIALVAVGWPGRWRPCCWAPGPATTAPPGRGWQLGRVPPCPGTAVDRPVRFLHVPNPAWRADGHVLDPARPERLVYRRGAGDRLVLAGVMFTAPRGTPGPAVGGPITRWHDHESCRDPVTRAKLGRPVDGTCPDGQIYRRSVEMMHVWFTDDLVTAFARRAPLAALADAGA